MTQLARGGIKNPIIIAFCFFLLCGGQSPASENNALTEGRDRISYSVGYQIGEDLKKQNADFDPDSFLKGAEDALSAARPQFSDEEMRAALSELKKKIVAQNKASQLDKRRDRLDNKEKNKGEGRDFLASNAKKQGVVTLPSGLQYVVITEGTGKSPGPHDTVLAEYRGNLVDGTEFDSTYRTGKPKTLHVDGVISGLREALQMMKEGAHWKIFIPADLAYGERGPLADRPVVFDLKLISIGGGR